jgi:hypothetical protein
MNCDEAFDALTDIDGRESDELERHLNLCPRCRQMREVLAPALSLFGTDDGSRFGGTDERTHADPAESIRKQFLSVEAVQMARETAQRLAAARKRRPDRPRRHTRWLIAQVAAAAAAVALAFTLFAPIASGPERKSSADAPGAVSLPQCLWKNRSNVDEARADSHAVVSRCVACHFEKAFD